MVLDREKNSNSCTLSYQRPLLQQSWNLSRGPTIRGDQPKCVASHRLPPLPTNQSPDNSVPSYLTRRSERSLSHQRSRTRGILSNVWKKPSPFHAISRSPHSQFPCQNGISCLMNSLILPLTTPSSPRKLCKAGVLFLVRLRDGMSYQPTFLCCQLRPFYSAISPGSLPLSVKLIESRCPRLFFNLRIDNTMQPSFQLGTFEHPASVASLQSSCQFLPSACSIA